MLISEVCIWLVEIIQVTLNLMSNRGGWTIKIGDAGDPTDPTYANNVSAYWSTDHQGIHLHFTDAVGKYVQILSKDWIVLCEIEVYGKVYDPLPLSSQCPKDYPYAYRPNNNLDRCCASINDRYGNVGINAIHNKGKRASSCQNDSYVSCMSPPCSDYGFTASLLGYRNVADRAKDCVTCSSGKYQDLDGETECKLCPPGTKRQQNVDRDDKKWDYQWVLLFRQTVLHYKNSWSELYGAGEISVNPNDPSQPDYSNLKNINAYANADGRYHLKLVWPREY